MEKGESIEEVTTSSPRASRSASKVVEAGFSSIARALLVAFLRCAGSVGNGVPRGSSTVGRGGLERLRLDGHRDGDGGAV